MRTLLVAGALLVSLLPADGAVAQGDPIMPLDEVRPGMRCTGYTVVRGTTVSSFDVEILDIVGGEGGARLLVKVSGDAVDETGVGAGFSGSPVYCRDGRGTARNAGAISETIGDYGGKTVLATPIEHILRASPDPPAPASGRRALASPLTVGGLAPGLHRALAARARREGRTVLRAPPVPLASPPRDAPFRPGSAVAIGLSTGDVPLAAVGTVAYVDGPRVWTLGHGFDGIGPRSLLLQTAYVATVVGNPVPLSEDTPGTYKLAGPVDDVGMVTDDTLSAVAGRVGGLPDTIPVVVFAHDAGDGRSTTTEARVADETALGTPTGVSALPFVGPLAVAQGASSLFDSLPVRLKGDVCFRVAIAELPRALRVCNRYVGDGTGAPPFFGNVVAQHASTDATLILDVVDRYRPADLHVTEFSSRIVLRRGQYQAVMRDVRLPRTARPGQRVRGRLRLRLVRGPRRTLRFSMRAPTRPGLRRVVLRGTGADTAEDDFFGTLTIDFGNGAPLEGTGPRSLRGLARAVRRVRRYDGVRINGKPAFRHPRLRIGGRLETAIRIRRPR